VVSPPGSKPRRSSVRIRSLLPILTCRSIVGPMHSTHNGDIASSNLAGTTNISLARGNSGLVLRTQCAMVQLHPARPFHLHADGLRPDPSEGLRAIVQLDPWRPICPPVRHFGRCSRQVACRCLENRCGAHAPEFRYSAFHHYLDARIGVLAALKAVSASRGGVRSTRAASATFGA
jgi:hypothetical protein